MTRAAAVPHTEALSNRRFAGAFFRSRTTKAAPMFRLALCGACLALLTACGVEPARRSVASTPIGTDASTGRPSITARGLGPGGINRDYYIGGDPNFPEMNDGGSRGR